MLYQLWLHVYEEKQEWSIFFKFCGHIELMIHVHVYLYYINSWLKLEREREITCKQSIYRPSMRSVWFYAGTCTCGMYEDCNIFRKKNVCNLHTLLRQIKHLYLIFHKYIFRFDSQ